MYTPTIGQVFASSIRIPIFATSWPIASRPFPTSSVVRPVPSSNLPATNMSDKQQQAGLRSTVALRCGLFAWQALTLMHGDFRCPAGLKDTLGLADLIG